METKFDIGEKVYCVGYALGKYMQSYPKIFNGTVTAIDIDQMQKIIYHIKIAKTNDPKNSEERICNIEEHHVFKEKKEVKKYLEQFMEQHILEIHQHVNLQLEKL